MLIGDADLELGALPHAHEGESMFVELLTGRGEFGARLGTLKKRPPEHVFEAFDACRHGGLREVHLARGMDETTGLGDDEEGACEVDVHALAVHCEVSSKLSIEISDSGHRKIPFVDGVDSHQIGQRPDRVQIQFGSYVRVHNGRTTKMAAKAKKAAKKAAAKKPAAKKKKR